MQLGSLDDEERSWERACLGARAARARGAALVALPENALYEGPAADRRHPLDVWEPRFAALARELEVVLVAGTIREPAPDGRAYNTCLVYGPDGARLARYRKVHLFDVDVPGAAERESHAVAPGEPAAVVVPDLPGVGTLGLAVCYDLRFPELFRALSAAGARTFVVPSSFSATTGKDHWLPLLQARAIENLAYVIAPDQFGPKPHRRAKHGRSLILDPWGVVLACARDVEEDVVVAEVDQDAQDRLRAQLPCLSHRRM